jgi:hypothetical protein
MATADNPLGFVAEVLGAEAAAHDLEMVGVRARDVRGISYKVRTVFRKAEEARFDRQGPGWPDLAEATKQRKARQGLSPRTMRAKNVLYRSLTSPRAADQVDRREQTEMEFGTSVPYAHWHEQGKGVPQRKLIDLSQRERNAIDEAIGEFIASGQV